MKNISFEEKFIMIYVIITTIIGIALCSCETFWLYYNKLFTLLMNI